MNRFEIITEKIGVIGKTLSDYETMYELKRSVEQLELGLRGAMFDNPEEVQFIKMQITDALYWLLVFASKRDHCGACMCGDLEEKLRHITERGAGMSMTVMQPTVVNQNNVPKGTVIVTEVPNTDPKQYISGTDPISEKISERGLELKRYQIRCDVFEMGGMGAPLMVHATDERKLVSVFTLPVFQNTEFENNPFYTQLCADLQKASGFPWYCEKHGGFIALKTQNKCEEISLITACTLKGEGVTRI